jgi:NADPH-dependent 2,4-dienoyl-CoA reductase/sulfur reductase-like enzyme
MRTLEQTYDVAVVGGGIPGFAAALTAAERGLSTILLERRPVLGWEGTWAFGLDAAEATSPLGRRVFAAVEDAGGRRLGRLDAPILEITLDRLATAAGLRVLFYATPLALCLDDILVAGVVFGWKNGEFTIRAKAFVDATENGFLWRETGQNLSPPEDPGASHSAYLNGARWESEEAISLGSCGGATEVTLKPSVWSGEVALEYGVERRDIRAARLLLPGVLRAAKELVPEIAPANVTHVGYEPMPAEHAVSAQDSDGVNPVHANLFGAGLWLSSAQQPNTLASRFACGERIGGLLVARFPGLRAPAKVAEGGQSLSAPPIHKSEVVVCGGGTGGALAGIAAAREGARTTLIEPVTFLGGIGSGGGIHMYYHGVAGGIQDELDQRVEALTPLFSGEGKAQGFHPEVKKVVLEQMADDAGATVVYDTTVTGVEMEDLATSLPATGAEKPVRGIRGVIAAGPEGGALYRAHAVIDSTGDADVAVMAGAPYTHGREKDELTHAYSQPSGLLGENATLRIVNFDAGYCDPTDLEDLTRARRHGLSHYFRDQYTPENRLLYVAPLLGLRNSRQIVGDYRLTLADEIEGREFPDVIAYAYSHFDNHGYDYENESDEAAIWVWLLGNWRRQFGCEIPYRCLLPQHVEGMLLACRALSMTHDAHNQLRMQRDMQRFGQAAGVAAAMAARAGVTPRAVDIAQLQQRLFELGDLGPRRRPELPAADSSEVQLHDDDWKPAPLPMKPVGELVRQLGGEDPRGVLWQLARTGQEAVPALLAAAKEDSPQKRLWSSFVLGIAGRQEAVPELISCLKSRHDEPTDALKSAPLWQSALVLLGRVGSEEATPALVEVLSDGEAGLDVLIGAVRSLGRIGDPKAADAVEALLTRDDLPVVRPLQISTNAAAGAVEEDCRWQLELAAAETLGRLGRKRPELAAKYLDDDRAYVRRYARKVLRELQSEE